MSQLLILSEDKKALVFEIDRVRHYSGCRSLDETLEAELRIFFDRKKMIHIDCFFIFNYLKVIEFSLVACLTKNIEAKAHFQEHDIYVLFTKQKDAVSLSLYSENEKLFSSVFSVLSITLFISALSAFGASQLQRMLGQNFSEQKLIDYLLETD